MIEDWNDFGWPNEDELVLRKGSKIVDLSEFPLDSKNYEMVVCVPYDYNNARMGNPVLCLGNKEDGNIYTLTFKSKNRNSILKFLGVSDEIGCAYKEARFLNELAFLPVEVGFNSYSTGSSQGEFRIVCEDGKCYYQLGSLKDETLIDKTVYDSFKDVVDATHERFVKTCAKKIRKETTDEPRIRERDRG
ncbi:MAG: hypothetical protein J6J24_05080 [Clostridia bacterium]|nr:hypothetical protein [Clostridia bacterium]